MTGRRRAGGPARRRASHKQRQLCTQVARSVGLTLVSECDDEVLQNMTVAAVEPAAGNRLAVTLEVHPPGSELSRDEVLERLELHRARIVEEVARAVHRRNVPELTFWVVKAGEPSDEPA
jgi:ribosome-binding factor A